VSAQLRGESPLAVVCRVLETPRSRVYGRARAADTCVADGELQAQIVRIAGQWPTSTYGYRRITAQLRREGAALNGKRVRRLMHELGLVGHVPTRRCRTTHSDHPYPRSPNRVAGLVITQPDAVWVADIPYVRLQHDFVSLALAVLMAVYPRAIRGWDLSRHLDQALTLVTLERAAATGRRPGIHHADQGVQ
jgi:putative transposase